MPFILRQLLPNGQVKSSELTGKNLSHLKFEVGSRYELTDPATAKAPQGLKAVRKGNARVLEVDGKEVLSLDGFYDPTDKPCYLDIHPLASEQSLVMITVDSPAIDDTYLMYEAGSSEVGTPWGWAAGIAGIVAASGGGHAPQVVQDSTAPTFTIAAKVSADGATVTGKTQPGAKVEIKVENGAVIGSGTAGPDGGFSVPLTSTQTNGEKVSITVTDNTSKHTTVTASAEDTTALAPPTVSG